MEIEKTHVNGCYDSLGVCSIKEVSVRNGENGDGWAVRLYGQHNELGFNCSIHNSDQQPFFNSWQPNDKIGMLYNPLK